MSGTVMCPDSGDVPLEYTIIERAADAFQQPVAREHIIAMCQRAFGEERQIVSVRELGGGLCNNIYLVHITDMLPVILRVSPQPSRQFRSEQKLMRNELASLPFLAPIAPLLPSVLMVDFTHQILERDYLFQTCMEGEQWAQVMDSFTSEENRMLWRQLGSITREIHAVQGEHFGSTASGPVFPTWSGAVIDWLTLIIRDLEEVQLDATDLRNLLDITQAHCGLLNEIVSPRLLHGDLWTVNILVKREKDGPRITAVLDSDRISWGDPLADWTLFLLHRNEDTKEDTFWETYGRPEENSGVQFRRLIYQGKYLGGARLEHHRLHHPESVMRSYRDMQAVIKALKEFSFDSFA
jgi:aminoglycoside phosphotransferase (APT) family kinase protein